MKDFYYILGTNVNCTPVEINQAYRNLSQKFRPDLNGNSKDFQNRFREITEAYETLGDPVKRRKYDAARERSKPRPPGYSKTKRTDIIFTCMLIMITLVFGYYVVKSVRGLRATNVKVADAAPVIKHHKRKHGIKTNIIKINNASPKVAKTRIEHHKLIRDTVKARSTPPPIVTRNDNADQPANASYDTFIRSNATGVVYMREHDDFNSAVVKVVPNNSKVTILEKGQRYYKVLFDNETGFVPKWTVQTK